MGGWGGVAMLCLLPQGHSYWKWRHPMCSHLSLNPRTMAPFLCVNLVFPLITDKVGGEGAFLHSTYEYCTMGVIDTHTHTLARKD